MAKKKQIEQVDEVENKEKIENNNPSEDKKIAYVTKKRIDDKNILITIYYVDGSKNEIIKEVKL